MTDLQQLTIKVLEDQHRAIEALMARLIAADPTFRPTKVLEDQHRAIDALMARLIAADPTFRPRQSGQIWDIVESGHKLIQQLKGIN